MKCLSDKFFGNKNLRFESYKSNDHHDTDLNNKQWITMNFGGWKSINNKSGIIDLIIYKKTLYLIIHFTFTIILQFISLVNGVIIIIFFFNEMKFENIQKN